MSDHVNLNLSLKRTLSRQYRQAPPPAGVYVIRNLAEPGHLYLGASLNVDGAMNRDRFELKQKNHRHRSLMDAWTRHGADALRFEIVDTVKRRDDPAFDPQAELDALLTLWTEELGREATRLDVLSAR